MQDPTPEPRLPSTRNGKQLAKLAEVLGAGRNRSIAKTTPQNPILDRITAS